MHLGAATTDAIKVRPIASFQELRMTKKMRHRYLDLPLLISWLSSRQYAPEGGFSGRTNKLVDGCYSHWVQGCWPLIEAALGQPQSSSSDASLMSRSLYSREGLTRYILSCCQAELGGLRDKPSACVHLQHSAQAAANIFC